MLQEVGAVSGWVWGYSPQLGVSWRVGDVLVLEDRALRSSGAAGARFAPEAPGGVSRSFQRKLLGQEGTALGANPSGFGELGASQLPWISLITIINGL